MAFLHVLGRLVLILLLLVGIGLGVVVTQRIAGARAGRSLDLGDTIGATTRAQLNGLAPEACPALLKRAGIAYRPLPPREQGAACGYGDGIVWQNGGSRGLRYSPAAPALACPLAAALALWEWDVVQPAAVRAYGTTVAEVDHYGTYSCRRIGGGHNGNWSEHSRAAALDVAGFRLADGRRVTVLRGWNGSAADAAFLREVRDGACRLFGTTLSPDYNAAHRDHLHLDTARRGGFGFCR